MEQSTADIARASVDPLMLDYHERVALPGYLGLPRFLALHTDVRAREQHLRRRREEAAEESSQLLARLMGGVGNSPTAGATASGAQGPPAAHVPLGFRRPEDLRVRCAGAGQSAGRVLEHLRESASRGAALAAELRRLGHQLAMGAATAARLHRAAVEPLAEGLLSDEVPSDAAPLGGATPAVAVPELVAALHRHAGRLSAAEQAWRIAEAGCDHGAGVACLSSEEEASAAAEEELAAAARELYAAAGAAASQGGFCARARCCQLWEEVGPELVAACGLRGSAWLQALLTAQNLAREGSMQGALRALLRSVERRRDLLGAEVTAPPEARRALAAMRAATTSASPQACGSVDLVG